MESIYWVLSWLCHRTCEHCYEDRFRPYYGDDLRRVVDQSRANFARVIENLPDRMTYLDLDDNLAEKTGRIILAGGEVLLEPVRETVLYPALDALRAKYGSRVHPIVQTTGDVLSERVLDQLLEHGAWLVSVSGLDAFHDGLSPEALREKLTRWFTSRGMTEGSANAQSPGPHFHFFGATPDSWIGRLWPRGRAWQNELSTATLSDNFCNRWSGGVNFLAYGYSGSEVAVDPDGNVFPCCMKTKLAIGNLIEAPLEQIVRRLTGNPVYEAISMGHPERMGVQHGWSVEKFLEKSETRLPSGGGYRNLCIGCDRFHEEVLTRESLVAIRPAGPVS
ncbi:MAG: SPASM domain-containing protein [Bryobacteraceae bacterium]